MSLTASFQQSRRNLQKLGEDYDSVDVDFQHRFGFRKRHDVVWGMGQRVWADREAGTFMVAFTPDHNRGHVTNVFVQDEMTLLRSLGFVVGSKLEHDSVSGFNVQPDARLSWTPGPGHSIWMAISRSKRTPSLLDRNIRVNSAAFQTPQGLPGLVALLGNPAFKPETVVAYETGYRVALPLHIQVDTTGFHSVYRNLRQDVPITFLETDPAPLHVVIGSRIDNGKRAVTTGAEMTARWSALPWWRLDAAYSWFNADFGSDAAGNLPNGSSPAHQWRFSSGTDLPRASRLDLNVYRIGTVEAFGVPAYTRVDARINDVLSPGVFLSITGRNLFDPRHLEFGTAGGATAGEIPRSIYLNLIWQF